MAALSSSTPSRLCHPFPEKFSHPAPSPSPSSLHATAAFPEHFRPFSPTPLPLHMHRGRFSLWLPEQTARLTKVVLEPIEITPKLPLTENIWPLTINLRELIKFIGVALHAPKGPEICGSEFVSTKELADFYKAHQTTSLPADAALTGGAATYVVVGQDLVYKDIDLTIYLPDPIDYKRYICFLGNLFPNFLRIQLADFRDGQSPSILVDSLRETYTTDMRLIPESSVAIFGFHGPKGLNISFVYHPEVYCVGLATGWSLSLGEPSVSCTNGFHFAQDEKELKEAYRTTERRLNPLLKPEKIYDLTKRLLHRSIAGFHNCQSAIDIGVLQTKQLAQHNFEKRYRKHLDSHYPKNMTAWIAEFLTALSFAPKDQKYCEKFSLTFSEKIARFNRGLENEARAIATQPEGAESFLKQISRAFIFGVADQYQKGVPESAQKLKAYRFFFMAKEDVLRDQFSIAHATATYYYRLPKCQPLEVLLDFINPPTEKIPDCNAFLLALGLSETLKKPHLQQEQAMHLFLNAFFSLEHLFELDYRNRFYKCLSSQSLTPEDSLVVTRKIFETEDQPAALIVPIAPQTIQEIPKDLKTTSSVSPAIPSSVKKIPSTSPKLSNSAKRKPKSMLTKVDSTSLALESPSPPRPKASPLSSPQVKLKAPLVKTKTSMPTSPAIPLAASPFLPLLTPSDLKNETLDQATLDVEFEDFSVACQARTREEMLKSFNSLSATDFHAESDPKKKNLKAQLVDFQKNLQREADCIDANPEIFLPILQKIYAKLLALIPPLVTKSPALSADLAWAGRILKIGALIQKRCFCKIEASLFPSALISVISAQLSSDNTLAHTCWKYISPDLTTAQKESVTKNLYTLLERELKELKNSLLSTPHVFQEEEELDLQAQKNRLFARHLFYKECNLKPEVQKVESLLNSKISAYAHYKDFKQLIKEMGDKETRKSRKDSLSKINQYLTAQASLINSYLSWFKPLLQQVTDHLGSSSAGLSISFLQEDRERKGMKEMGEEDGRLVAQILLKLYTLKNRGMQKKNTVCEVLEKELNTLPFEEIYAHLISFCQSKSSLTEWELQKIFHANPTALVSVLQECITHKVDRAIIEQALHFMPKSASKLESVHGELLKHAMVEAAPIDIIKRLLKFGFRAEADALIHLNNYVSSEESDSTPPLSLLKLFLSLGTPVDEQVLVESIKENLEPALIKIIIESLEEFPNLCFDADFFLECQENNFFGFPSLENLFRRSMIFMGSS